MTEQTVSAIEREAGASGCETERDAVLKNYTTFKIGGKCPLLVKMRGEESFIRLIPLAEKLGARYCIFGKGSNLLVDSDGVDRIVFLSGNGFSGISFLEDTVIRCETGASLSALCKFACENSLTGLEFAYGIPGSVGGAVFMNAGAYGGEIKDVVISVRAMDKKGKITEYHAGELDFSYRRSRFSNGGEIILTADFKLNKGDEARIKADMEDILGRRRAKQPLEYPSAGSTFKRPKGSYASLLIEQCGLKGVHVGDAEVSTKHSGFIINKGSADFSQVIELIKTVRERVLNDTGYKLECEPLILTDKPTIDN